MNMKKGVAERDFIKIKKQFKQIEEIAKHTKGNALWEHEAAVRKKIMALKGYETSFPNRNPISK